MFGDHRNISPYTPRARTLSPRPPDFFSKVRAKGRLEQVKTILGVTLDNGRLLMPPSTDKNKEWSAGTRKVFADK
jgi:hypothetical protein